MSTAYTAITSIKITPHNDTSLLVKWTSLETASLRGYVVEWRPLLQTDPSNIQFQSTSKNQSSLIIAGMFYGFWRGALWDHILNILSGCTANLFIPHQKNSNSCSYARSFFFSSCEQPAFTQLRAYRALIQSNLFILINRQHWAIQALWDLCVS